MGFYGKVINYLTKAFAKIKIGTGANAPVISAKEYDDTLTLIGDSHIILTPDAENNKLTFSHNEPGVAATTTAFSL
jgi:hypothetical protein